MRMAVQEVLRYHIARSKDQPHNLHTARNPFRDCAGVPTAERLAMPASAKP